MSAWRHWRAVLCACLLCPLLALTSAPTRAHTPSTAFLTATTDASGLQLRLDLSVRDSASLVPMDHDSDRQITWGEALDALPALTALLQRRLRLQRGGQPCHPQPPQMAVSAHGAEPYLQLSSRYHCPAEGAVALTYSLLFGVDSDHRVLARLDDRGHRVSAVLTPAHPHLRSADASPAGSATLLRFWREGIAHILAGYDHLLFLTTLLLPCVLQRRHGHWQPQPSPVPVLRQVLLVVTAFTLGHSLTLGLVVLGLVPAPGPWIETAIAVSIVLAAANNLAPLLPLSGTWLAGSLGLLHGFGFANALFELGLSAGQAAVPLLGFNLGVETGQLLVVGLTLPVLLTLRRSAFYPRAVLTGGSCLAAALGAFWALQTLGL